MKVKTEACSVKVKKEECGPAVIMPPKGKSSTVKVAFVSVKKEHLKTEPKPDVIQKELETVPDPVVWKSRKVSEWDSTQEGNDG